MDWDGVWSEITPWPNFRLVNQSSFCTMFKGSLGGETSVLRTFRMSGKELVKERVSQGKVS